MRLIDADELYEKTAEWEARALAVVEKLTSEPFVEMDVDEITEWRRWSCILNERSAFKYDVADAPTIEPQQWIPVTERLPEPGVEVWLTIKGHDVITLQGDETLEEAFERVMNLRWVTRGYWSDEEKMWCDSHFGFPLPVQPVAWMPIDVPEAWKGGES